MLEHGLPILVNDDNDTPRDKITIDERFQNQIFIVNDKICLEKLLNEVENKKNKIFNGVSYTTNELLNRISKFLDNNYLEILSFIFILFFSFSRNGYL